MLPRNTALTHQIPCCLVLTLAVIAHNSAGAVVNMLTAPNTTKPGCPRRCGNLIVPYPFGIGTGPRHESNCSIHPLYNINCNTSFHPPKAFLNDNWNLEIIDISETSLRVRNVLEKAFYNTSSGQLQKPLNGRVLSPIHLPPPYIFSNTQNSFVVMGCNVFAVINQTIGLEFPSVCLSSCLGINNYENNQTGGGPYCSSGHGCCRNSIPRGLREFNVAFALTYIDMKLALHITPYTYAFIAETDSFKVLGAANLSDPEFEEKIVDHVPIVLDWVVGKGTNCIKAREDATTYACQGNTSCTDSNDTASGTYRCNCLPGYEGNPYLSPGCTGTTSALLFIATCMIIICITTRILRSQRLGRMKEKFFKQNGGLLLMRQLASNQNGMQSTKVFTTKELKLATNNYSNDRLLGIGGYGNVYKGILSNNQVVAIKKSKVADQSQVEQFINEVVILTGINHRNVVKLLGCCLEEEAPLLVYEFISNGTLFEHIHKRTSWLTWTTCIRIASESANALSYLHSAASIPIIHRDVKTTNILIDDTYTAKISDFGASRLVPLDQTRVTTLILGTLGYLDPEYFHTSQLTEKSDVYSFGVVLAELLTREKPVCIMRRIEDRNLASHLVLAMKENRLLEIVHPQLIKEAIEEQLVSFAKLVEMCLSVKGEDRPTMKEVALKLDELKKNIKHPWTNKPIFDERGTSFMLEHPSSTDLYPPPLCSDINTSSEQISSI